MNKFLIFIVLLIISITSTAQTPFKGTDYMFYYQMNVGKTNGSLTTPSAWLEVGKDSTTKGLRIPRVVDTSNISSAIYGLLIYQIRDNSLYFRDKTGWRRMADPTALNSYLLKSDSTIYYPYWSNPRGYLSTELDPVANSKTVRWIAGTGISVSNGTAQALTTNPVATISAQNTIPLWNASQIQGSNVSAATPTNGQVLQYNGTQYAPFSLPNNGNYIFNQTGTIQSGAGFNIGSTGRINGSSLSVRFASNNNFAMNVDATSVDGAIRSFDASTGTRRPIGFDGLKYTFYTAGGPAYYMNIDNGVVAIDSIVSRTTIGYTGLTTPAPFDSVKLHIKGDIVATARTYTTGGYTPLVRNNTTGRFEVSSAAGAPTLHAVTTAGNVTSNGITVNAFTANGTSAFNASIRPQVTVLTDGSSLDETMVTVVGNTLSGNCTLTLPTGVGMSKTMYFIRRSDPGNVLTIQTSGSDVFNYAAGPTTFVVTNSVIVQLFGQVWYVLGHF